MQSTPIRFGSDHGALRSEDDPLLTGRGQFTDDMNAPDQAYGMFVRATACHAVAFRPEGLGQALPLLSDATESRWLPQRCRCLP